MAHTHTNRLAQEKSPYLLQHAHNPVDWYPWGSEAFALARSQDKPIFLSVGYSTCHWCHVMEHESFESEEVAKVMNELFVNIKVDREERPDVDRAYMSYVTATTGSGGWPMSVFLTPELTPIFGGTYFPPTDSFGRPGFVTLLRRVAAIWQSKRDALMQQGRDVMDQLKDIGFTTSAKDTAWDTLPVPSILDRCVDQFAKEFDKKYGGFGGAPKFPRPVILTFLLCMHGQYGKEAQKLKNKLDGLKPPLFNRHAENEPEQEMGDSKKALAGSDLEKAEVSKNMGMKSLAEGNAEAATVHFTDAIVCNPTSSLLFANRGKAFLSLDKPKSCLRDCTKAIALNPDSALAYKIRGQAHLKLEEWEDAIDDMRKANQFDYDEQTYQQMKKIEAEKSHEIQEKRKKRNEYNQTSQMLQKLIEKQEHVLTMCTETLSAMYRGGMYDHLGGGFHRYSVDKFWHIPHFEKMLYDQGQLMTAYSEAFQLTQNPEFKTAVVETLNYILTQMTHPLGGIFSAEDADSLPTPDSTHKKEGAFYVFSHQELCQILSKDEQDAFFYAYGVKENGNIRPNSDPHGELTQKNHFFMEHTTAEAASFLHKPEDQIKAVVSAARHKLFEYRNKRPRPHLDDKILTAWNGLMISGLARGYQVFGDVKYLEAAQKASEFIHQNMFKEGHLLRSYREGPSTIKGFLSDYAFLIQGLIDLYESGGGIKWLKWSEQLQHIQDRLFWDSQDGGYFTVSGEDPSILLRAKGDEDNAEPSGNSVAALNLLRLSVYTGNDTFSQKARELLVTHQKYFHKAPSAVPLMLAALDGATHGYAEIVVVGSPASPDTKALVQVIYGTYSPHRVIMFLDEGESGAYLREKQSMLTGFSQVDGKATVYVCQDFTCQLPVTDPHKLSKVLLNSMNHEV